MSSILKNNHVSVTANCNLRIMLGNEFCTLANIGIYAFIPCHVETVVLLSREKVDGYIDIDLDVERFKAGLVELQRML